MIELSTASVGVQWAWAKEGIVFSPRPEMSMGNPNFMEFPNRVAIRGVLWQSSVKVDDHEVLLHFMVWPGADSLQQYSLFSTHHVSLHTPTMVIKPLMFGDGGITIPENTVVWVYGSDRDWETMKCNRTS